MNAVRRPRPLLLRARSNSFATLRVKIKNPARKRLVCGGWGILKLKNNLEQKERDGFWGLPAVQHILPSRTRFFLAEEVSSRIDVLGKPRLPAQADHGSVTKICRSAPMLLIKIKTRLQPLITTARAISKACGLTCDKSRSEPAQMAEMPA